MDQRGYGKHEGPDSRFCNDLKPITEPALREILQIIALLQDDSEQRTQANFKYGFSTDGRPLLLL
jgi:hypothetical protein